MQTLENSQKKKKLKTYMTTVACIIKKGLREVMSVVEIGRMWGSIRLLGECQKQGKH